MSCKDCNKHLHEIFDALNEVQENKKRLKEEN